MSRRKTSNRQGKIFVVSSPSGGGKTSLSQEILQRLPNLARSVSMTTRKPRAKEKDGRDYFFVSEKKFKSVKSKNGFLEEATVFGFEYGTPKKFIDNHLKKGLDVLLLIDVQGAMKIRDRCGARAILIFIMPPSIEELESRLVKRSTDSWAVIQSRLMIARQEIQFRNQYDYVIENRNFYHAVREFESIITAERLKKEPAS